MTIQIKGVLENLGKTITGGVGAEIRGTDGLLIVIPGLSHEQLRELAPLLFEHVTMTIAKTEKAT